MKAHSESPEVRLVIEDTWARISLNRPKVGNALGPSMVDELDRAVDRAHDAGARMIVFEGAGKHMCTGFDLSELDKCSDGDILLRFVCIEHLLQKIYASPVVTAAIGSGRVCGAGADIFAACDRRIGLPDASFAFPGSGFGLILGTRRLAARIGRETARRILLEGAELPVETAAEIGLVTDRCSVADVEDLLARMAVTAARLDPITVAALHTKTISRDDDADLAALVNSASRPNLKERIEAYRQRAMAARKK
jgi:enoyl-CoA hydratase/carnithine racemase